MRTSIQRLTTALALASFTLISDALFAATYTVTVTNDSGAGSLRQAILDANASGGADTIDFNIASGVSILVATNLPPITDPVAIDATTQPGWVNAPIIEINGANVTGAGQDGFKIWAGSTTIRGLVINRFTGDGIEIATNGNNIIEGCYLGTGLSGTNDLGNTLCGIFITNSTLNVIGGTNAAQRNVISGNNQQGILIGGTNSFSNQILGNLIGLGANGSNTVANSQNGIHVHNSRSNIIGGTVSGSRNVISGNTQAGIRVELAQAFGNQILGNYIGLEISGGTNRANAVNGITLITAPSNFVGNDTSEGRNVISGNTGIGISLSTANNITIQGNYIGTDATGTLDRGNTTDGINANGATNSIIGGSNPSEGNLISGNNNDGIEITGAGSTNVVILGNFIGTDLTGNNALGNGQHGIHFATSARFNRIGGTGGGEPNVIAFSTGDGIYHNGASNNTLRANAIFSNGDLGIDLGTTGVTANDPGDGDTGANLQQNFPVLTTATNSATGTVVEGALNSRASTPFALDFFASEVGDNSDFGQGRFYLGSTNVTTDGAGNITFSAPLAVTNLSGRFITATATDPDGNTSEFARWVLADSSLPGQTFTVINTNDSGSGSLREAILNANTNITAGHRIEFAIPGAGVQVIAPASALPVITSPVTIDGYTQPGSATNTSATAFNGTVLIQIDALNAGANALTVVGGGTTIRGLIIVRSPASGIELSFGDGNSVRGCLIGVDGAGTDLGNTADGIFINYCNNNAIGGTNVDARNVISGNNSDGISVTTDSPAANTILGNLIGTDLTGTLDRGNTADGIFLNAASGVTVGGVTPAARNIISGNNNDGIQISGAGSSSNVVVGNYIGLDVTGSSDLGNGASGVFISAVPNNTVGGTSPGAGNFISGNNDGIIISLAGAINNVIAGNFIGTDATGLADVGNADDGVLISGSSFNLVGGTTAAARNLIAGNNGDGVEITGSGASANIIHGNWIGLNAAAAPLGNGASGVFIISSARENQIGGTGAGEANIIANNSTDGVQHAGGTNNAIRLNSIFNNGDLGIDLGTTGVTPNDFGDVDTGANLLQNFPVITATTNDVASVTIHGTLNSKPIQTFDVDFFATSSGEPSGAGEGQVYLGSTVVATDGAGDGSFGVTLPGSLTARYVTATATDALGNTSEFSAQHFAASLLAVTNFVVINTNDSGPGSLRDAITNANAYISAGNDIISFAIPGTGPHVISPASALPQLSDPVTIDGFTQTNAAANTLTNGLNTVLQIHLNGSSAGAGVDGLQVAISGCITRGLAITGFTQDGVDISRGTGISIEGCFIGMTPDGLTRAGNLGSGVNLSSSNAIANFIGGETPAARNLISANTSYGVAINSARQNIVAGNLIGTDLTGTLSRGNTNSGVLVSGATARLNVIGGTNAAARNVLSGNGSGFNGSGMVLSGCISNFIYGNYCGISVTGTSALANGENGIEIINAAHTNFIGSALAGAGNVLSGNPNAGIYIFGGSTSLGNVIQGNRIGTSASGMSAVPNLNRGVLVGTAKLTLVGGANPGEGNLISGNTGSTGVEIACCGTSTNRILGNWIGTDATGTNALPNYLGIQIFSPDNAVGGTNSGEGNRIWFNSTYGVYVDIGAVRVPILGNSIHANGSLGIELDGDGVTLNDAGDPDTGSNGKQNFPVLAFALTDTNTLSVPGTFNGATNTPLRLEFFASPTNDLTGYGEGRDFLGATNINTDGAGNASFTFITTPSPATGHFITATATTTNGNSSEFSAATKAVPFDSVDLQISLTASTNPASIALGFNYTNTIVNAGPTNAIGVLVTNFLPAGINILSSNASQGSVSTAPGLVIWNIGNLDYSSNAVLVLSVNGGITGQNTNTANVVSVEFDHTLGNNSTNKVITLGLADLAVTMTDSPDPVIAGQSLTLITTVTNLGPDPATLVLVNLYTPGSLVVTSTVVSQGIATLASPSSYDWSAGTIAPGGFATFTVIGVPTEDGSIDTSAYASRAEADVNMGNDSALISTTVDPGAGILQLSSASFSASESAGSVSVAVSRSGGTIGIVTVDVSTADLTATAGSDYQGTNITLTFTNGESLQVTSIPVLNDPTPECNEYFSVLLSNATGGGLALLTTNATVSIFDNDISSSGGLALISRSTNGASGDNSSYSAIPSADGRFVAFQSYAEDLVANDSNGREDVFIINVTNGAITLVSADISGTNSGNRISFDPRISTDGRFVAFYSESTNLVAGATNPYGDIYLRDTVSGSTRLISVNTNGTGPGNDYSSELEMTPDARFIVFTSYSTNLSANDLNGFDQDVFLRDTNSATCEAISLNSAGTGTGNSDSYGPSVSGDGRYVAFQSDATNLGPADANVSTDIFVRDRNLGTNYLCSRATGGGSANGYSFDPLVSSNGAIVLFSSYANDIVTGDTNSYLDIFAYNTTNHTVQLVTVNLSGSGGNNYSYSPRISHDGRYVAFESFASDLVVSDLNGQIEDIFIRDLLLGTTTLISMNCEATSSGNSDSYSPSISADGRYVSFVSVASDLTPGDFSLGYDQVFRHDRQTGLTVLASQNSSITAAGDSFSFTPEINADGHIIAFLSDASDIVTNSIVVVPNAMIWDATAVVAPSSNVNLVLEKTASTNTLVEFTPLTYTLTITNIGTLASSATVVTDALPANLTFISAATSVGTVTNSGGLVTANLGALGINANALITITAMPTNSGVITNLALATSPETDLVPADNTGTAIVTVTAFPPPSLYTQRTNSNLLILWPSNTPPVFVLESKTNLQPAFTWSPVTNAVATLGTNNSVTLTPDLSERTRFFRLRR